MGKVYTIDDLSRQFDEDMIWRRKEISDIKLAIKSADAIAKTPLLKALLTMCYAHWEGYVRTCATKYFQFITIRRSKYSELNEQFYFNSFLARLDSLYQSKTSLETRCLLISEIMEGLDKKFSYINPGLIDTKSNLNSDVIKEICLICAVDDSFFEEKRIFIDSILLKRRNSIAHGQQETILEKEMNDLVDGVMSLMAHFRTLLENQIYAEKFRRYGQPAALAFSDQFS